jgi:hypothetical protein
MKHFAERQERDFHRETARLPDAAFDFVRRDCENARGTDCARSRLLRMAMTGLPDMSSC